VGNVSQDWPSTQDMTEAKLMRERQTLQQHARARRREDLRRKAIDMARDPIFTQPLIEGGAYALTQREKAEIHESVRGRQRWHRLL
jgi:hypothetical protein